MSEHGSTDLNVNKAKENDIADAGANSSESIIPSIDDTQQSFTATTAIADSNLEPLSNDEANSSAPVSNNDNNNSIVPIQSDDNNNSIVPIQNDDNSNSVVPIQNDDNNHSIVPIQSEDKSSTVIGLNNMDETFSTQNLSSVDNPQTIANSALENNNNQIVNKEEQEETVESIDDTAKLALEQIESNPLPKLPASQADRIAKEELAVGTVLNLFNSTPQLQEQQQELAEQIREFADGASSAEAALSRWQRPVSVDIPQPTESLESEASLEAEDIADLSVLDGSHPIMDRVQAAIAKTLQAKIDAVEVELRDGAEKVSHAVKQREEVGVTLYNLQQQLAKAQAQLEQREEATLQIKSYREEAERNLKHTLEAYSEISAKKKELEKLTEDHKSELESVLQTLKQVNVYQEELLSKIQVARRTTLKAEEDLKKVEWDKQRQDYYVDKLEQQLRQQEEKRTMYEVQLAAQRAETAAATSTLREAAAEMEELSFEKRQLLQQWRSSVLGVERRVEQIRSVDHAQQHIRDTISELETEISSMRHSIRKTAEEGERLHGVVRKLESEQAYVERQIQGVQQEHSQLQEQYHFCQKTLQETEASLSSAGLTKRNLQRQLNTLIKSVHQTENKSKQLEVDLEEYMQDQQAVAKGNEMTVREYRKLRQLSRDKEALIIQTENEVSKTREETFKVEVRLDSLKSEHTEMETELHKKLELIERYEVTLKRQADELAKKQNEVDFLNKKIEKMTANGGESIENMGPLEATIKNTLKLIKAKIRESEELESLWLRNQNEYVNLQKTIDNLRANLNDNKTRRAVLSRKKERMNALYDEEEAEIRVHKRKIRDLEHQMKQLNTLIVKQQGNQAQLQELTTGLEQQLRQRLKDSELDVMHLESQILDTQNAKEQAVSDLVEAERQVMLWDKKIQLAKETRAALDPNVGANEIREMTKEIHRMKLRYASMLKLQEKMVSEMERAVQRRELLTIKNSTKSKGSAQNQLAKTMAELNKKHRQTIGGIQICNEDLVALLNGQDHIQRQIEEAQSACRALLEKEKELEGDALYKASQRIALHIETLLYQKHGRRYEDIITGKVNIQLSDVQLKQQEKGRYTQSLQEVQAIILKAINSFPVPTTAIPLSTVSEIFPALDSFSSTA